MNGSPDPDRDARAFLIDEAMEDYEKVAPTQFYIDVEPQYSSIVDPQGNKHISGFKGTLNVVTDGKVDVLGRSRTIFQSVGQALADIGRNLVVVPVRTKEGWKYPWYNESKGKALREARGRRMRRAAKHLALLIALSN